ncbi:MAG: winged helix-turn-helix domain-containing protein, partial [Saprospiraceae bacterium]|nr:winged helix-turn-helix domain-containing protein [Saprospiraceae bacterium]
VPLIFLIIYLLSTTRAHRKSPELSDYRILKTIAAKPDCFITAHDLAEETGISVRMARKRLSSLSMYGVVHSYFSDLARSHYTLKPADNDLIFNDNPVRELTFEHLLDLFANNGFQLTVAKIIAATGMDLHSVRKAVKEFKKDKVIYSLQDYQNNKVLLLREPYRSNLATLSLPLPEKKTLDLENLASEMENRQVISSKDLAEKHQISEETAQDLLEELAKKITLKIELGEDGEKIFRL